MLTFFVQGSPLGDPRPIAGRSGWGRKGKAAGRAVLRRDPKADPWKVTVRRAALDALGLSFPPALPVFPQGTPVALGFLVVLARPTSHWRAAGGLAPRASRLPTCKPDLDNLAKAFKDALGNWSKKGPIAWHDDAQVVAYDPAPWKVWAERDEPAGVLLIARAVSEPPAVW